MTAKQLTRSELQILKVLDSAPDKTEELYGIRHLVKLSRRGIWIVINRMQARNLVSVSYTNHNPVSMTFGGMRALKAVSA
jgi:hypothetical protein